MEFVNVVLVLFVFIGCVAPFLLDGSPGKKPNIVFILADDYGYNDIGYHGSEIRTPNLDKLASSGVRLENYYVQPICSPTRSQLLSGRYQIHTGLQHGVINPSQANGLPLENPTIADKLKEAGYATHMVGKWHLGFYKKEYLPTNRGFDSFYGYLTDSEDYFTHYMCLDDMCGHDLLDDLDPVTNANGTYSTHLFTNRSINIINKHDVQQPLFLYVPFQAVHRPLQVPDKYTEPYKNITNAKRRTYAGKFTSLNASWPGSCHDSHVFRTSGLCQRLERDNQRLSDGILLGDSGYPCRPFLMTPFLIASTPGEQAYQQAHTRTRVTIERAFGRLKRRFHVLHSEVRLAPLKVCKIVTACAILHNIAIMLKDDLLNDGDDEVDDNDDTDANGEDFRNAAYDRHDGKAVRRHIVEHYF